MNDLNDKIALITGATSGIGEACAKRFALAGATVIVAGRNEDNGQKIVEDILLAGGNAIFTRLDVTDDNSIDAVYQLVMNQFGKLDILVNNAGVYPMTPPIEEMTREFNNSVLNTNTSGTIMVTKKFLDLLIKNHGNILNNSSVAGLLDYNAGAAYAYSASKAGVIKFSQLLAKKYGDEIRVNCICPGVIRTPIFKKFDEERYAAGIPMGRVGEPDDVAKVANFLVSEDAGYLNGCVINVDGGQAI